MKRKSKGKKILISAVALVLAAATGLGVWYYVGHSNTEPVNVYPFYYIGMTEYWGDSRESYGPVTTDRIQTIYLSDTQTVTEILVAQGDVVKKGDLLMTFDTTLSDLALERERLEVEKLKLRLEDAKDELRRINSMKPMVIPTYTEDDTGDENLGTALKGDYQISTQSQYDGSTRELALICWIRGDRTIDDGVLEAIRQQAEAFQQANAEKELSGPGYTVDLLTFVTGEEETTEPEVTEPETTEPEVTEPETTEPETTEPEVTEPEVTEPESTEPETTEPEATQPEETEPVEVTVDQFYVVFKVTAGNMSLGATEVWQGMLVKRDPNTNKFTFQFFNADGLTDHTLAADEEPATEPEIDFGSGYTAAQIAELRTQQEKTIRDLEFDIKMAEADYKIMQTEVSDGKVYAEIDGTVVSVLTEDEAKMMQQPVVKVSGGGGFYVEGSVSELEKDSLEIGQEVTINDWNTGMVYTGTVASIGDFPTENGYYYGMGNPNASYYPFTVFVDGSADLQAGSYVSVTYSSGSAEQGIYLENPFLRTEQGKSYIYVRGEDGTLEKRYVTTGKSLWGSYTEILEGLSEEDYIAFPYGKNVKQGAQTVESDLSALYDY